MRNCLIMVSGGVDNNIMTNEADGIATRILDAALECLARYGVAKTSADDIAKAAGCSRASLYRHYENKQAIFNAVVAREMARLRDELQNSVAADATLTQALTAIIVTAARHAEAIPALQFVLSHEPEAVMGCITFDRADAVLALAAEVGARLLTPWLATEAAYRAGELVGRLLLTHLPDSHDRALTDPETVRSLVHDFVVPGLIKIPNQAR